MMGCVRARGSWDRSSSKLTPRATRDQLDTGLSPGQDVASQASARQGTWVELKEAAVTVAASNTLMLPMEPIRAKEELTRVA